MKKIRPVMGGYLDENNKLMTRAELNAAIANIQDENENVKKENNRLRKENKNIAKYKGIACLKYDLIHYMKCDHCYDELEIENEKLIKVLKMYKDQCDYYSSSLAGSWWDAYNEALPYIVKDSTR